MKIEPQPGFQTLCLSSPADVAIMGGSAGCGKTFTLLMEPLRNVHNPKFTATVFRRTTPQISAPGGLWDTSETLFPLLHAEPVRSRYYWRFPSRARVEFRHLEYEKNLLDWQGSQIPLIMFDELTHFTEKMFFYFFSRNRSDSGVKGYIRASCNPDPDSWVARFIEWWIDQDTGFPIKERAGVLRYMTRDGEAIVWGDSVEEVVEKCPHIFNNEALIESGVEAKHLVKSVTFIPGSIYDNKIFISKDPGYLGNLMSLPEEERSQLMDGNWKIRLDGLELFDPFKLNEIFSNYPEQSVKPYKCITVDAARFGQDLCTIFVWKGWEVVHISIFIKSDVHDITKEIESLRLKFHIMRTDVLVDQDGVGGDTVKLGKYVGFSGGAKAVRDPETRVIENYENLKTQCYYKLAIEHINTGNIRISISNETCKIFEDGSLTGRYTTKLKMKGVIVDVRDLIKQDLRAIKRAGFTMERKLKINPKEEQKNILGRSPDFGDNLMMRKYMDLRPKPKTMTRR